MVTGVIKIKSPDPNTDTPLGGRWGYHLPACRLLFVFVFPFSPCLMTSHMIQYSCCLSINVSLSHVCIETSLSLFRLPPGGGGNSCWEVWTLLAALPNPPAPPPHTSHLFQIFCHGGLRCLEKGGRVNVPLVPPPDTKRSPELLR